MNSAVRPLARRVHDVLRHGQQREQPEALVDDGHLLPPVLLQRHGGGADAAAQHLAGGGQVQPRHQGQQGGLAAAGAAYHRVEQARVEAVADALQGIHLLVLRLIGICYVLKFECGHGALFLQAAKRYGVLR